MAPKKVSPNSPYHPIKVVDSESPPQNVDSAASAKRRRQSQEAPTSKTIMMAEVDNSIICVII